VRSGRQAAAAAHLRHSVRQLLRTYQSPPNPCGFRPSQQLWASCIDIDPKAADMAYIQLSLLGIPAEVITGNTLTMAFSRTRFTPVYYLNDWPEKFAFRDRVKAMKKVLSGFAA